MSNASSLSPDTISDGFISTVCARLAENKPVRRKLPKHGRLHIDRQLPFLCIYRQPPNRQDQGTVHLLLAEASYLIVSGDQQLEKGLAALVQNIVKTLSDNFGAFLIVEIWSATADSRDDNKVPLSKPVFRIITPRTEEPPTTIAILAKALQEMTLPGQAVEVEVVQGGIVSPPGLSSLLTTAEASKSGCLLIGLEIPPIYRDPQTGELFPAMLRALHRELSRALQKTFFEFMHVQTTHRPEHYQVLGRRAMVKAVWQVDRQLAQINGSFKFLLAVTPVNVETAWAEFQSRNFEYAPVFHYRLLSTDPELLKRKLYNIPLERVEDPTLADLFREKRNELDRQITMLEDRDTPNFLYGSLQLFGGVDDELLRLAQGLLAGIPPHDEEDGPEEHLDATTFADRSRAEIEYYRQKHPAVSATVEIRDDVPSLMVSEGNLLISRRTKIIASWVEAALQHEVGTHILTYFNGRAQPLQQLYCGLPGYDELQEGLAVLAEYMVGGLSRSRLRLLAGRVVAVHRLVEGVPFVEIFRELNRTHGFEPRTAFTITMRVYRGGGLTKDAVYLRGLAKLLNYLKEGGALEPLFVGKIRMDQIPIVQELQWREVLRPAPLRPHYMESAEASEKLERLRSGLSVLDLIERK
jgi:uncharacterized protein (TIGR02421 family)